MFVAISQPAVWWNELIVGSAAAVGDEFGFGNRVTHLLYDIER